MDLSTSPEFCVNENRIIFPFSIYTEFTTSPVG